MFYLLGYKQQYIQDDESKAELLTAVVSLWLTIHGYYFLLLYSFTVSSTEGLTATSFELS